MDRSAPDPLRAIRQRIDQIDEAIHRLLIDRASVIDELIRAKGASASGATFRPQREAEMMRRLVLRHEGDLPLSTVEHIWRELISTFTAMQAPYRVAVAPGADPLAVRDLVRFYFGFFVPISPAESAEAAIARVAGSGDELAVIPLDSPGAWWRPLVGERAPKVFARIPFIESPDHPVRTPAYVVGPPLQDGGTPDVRILVLQGSSALADAIASVGGSLAGEADGAILAEIPVAVTQADLDFAAGVEVGPGSPVGGFAQPIHVIARRPTNQRLDA